MAFVSDFLVVAAALGAALYCFILSRRLQALTRLDGGLGSAIALLSAQVDDLSRTLRQARENADSGAAALNSQTARAEAACQRLELLLATLHDLPADGERAQGNEAAPAAGPADCGRARAQGQGWPVPENAGATRQSPRTPDDQAPRARIVRRRQPMERA